MTHVVQRPDGTVVGPFLTADAAITFGVIMLGQGEHCLIACLVSPAEALAPVFN